MIKKTSSNRFRIIKMISFLMIVYLVMCAGLDRVSSKISHTTAYNDYKTGKIESLALRYTYLGWRDGLDPCMKVNDGTAFRNLLKKEGMACNGEFCDDHGTFSCLPQGTVECYYAMHIISPTISQVEYPLEYDRNILANYVMSYGKWVSEMRSSKNWEVEKSEKQDILEEIFDFASDAVRTCHRKENNLPTPAPKINPTPKPVPSPAYSHTQLYKEWKAGTFDHKDFFQRNTFLGASTDIDPCTPVKSRDAYISLLKSRGVKCEGRWCDSNGEWKCPTSDCYNREHIIDTQNSDPEFGPNYNKDIIGNYIFAYSSWNKGVGNLKNWESIKNEKREIYGDIFDIAYRNVKNCISTTPPPQDDDILPDINIDDEDVEIFFNILTAIFIFAFLTAGVCVVYRSQTIPEEEDDVETPEENLPSPSTPKDEENPQ